MHIQKHFSLIPTEDKNLENLVNELAESKKNIREIQKFGTKIKKFDENLYKDNTNIKEKDVIQTSHNFFKKKDKAGNSEENINGVNRNTTFINKELRENKNLHNKHKNNNIFYIDKDFNDDNLSSYNSKLNLPNVKESKLFQRIFKNITEEKIKSKNKKIENKNLNSSKNNHLSESIIELKKVLDDKKKIISTLKFKNKSYNSQSIYNTSFDSENSSFENFHNCKGKNLENVLNYNFKNSNENIEKKRENKEKEVGEKKEEKKKEKQKKKESQEKEKKKKKKEKKDNKEEKASNINNITNEYSNIISENYSVNCKKKNASNVCIENNDKDQDKKYKTKNMLYKNYKGNKINNKKKKLIIKSTYKTNNNNTSNNENDIHFRDNKINNKKYFCNDNYSVESEKFYLNNEKNFGSFRKKRKNIENSRQKFSEMQDISKINKNHRCNSLKERKLHFKMLNDSVHSLRSNDDFIFKNKSNYHNKNLLNTDISYKKKKEKNYLEKINYIKNPLKENFFYKLSKSPFSKFQILALKKKKKKISFHFSISKKYKKKNIEKHINIFKKCLYRNKEDTRDRINEKYFNNFKGQLNNHASDICIRFSLNNTKDYNLEKNSKDNIKNSDNVLKEFKINNNVGINYSNNNNTLLGNLYKKNKYGYSMINSNKNVSKLIRNNLNKKLNKSEFVENYIKNEEKEKKNCGNNKKLSEEKDKIDKLYKGIKSALNYSLKSSDEKKISSNFSNENIINLNNSNGYDINSNKSISLNNKINNYINKSDFINRASSIEKYENIKKNTILDNCNLVKNNYKEKGKNISDISGTYSSKELITKRDEVFYKKEYKKNTKYMSRNKNKFKNSDKKEIMCKNDDNNKYKHKNKKKILMEVLSFYKRYNYKLKMLLLEEYNYLKCLRTNISKNTQKIKKFKNGISDDYYTNEEFEHDKEYFDKIFDPLSNYLSKDHKVCNLYEENRNHFVNGDDLKKKEENLIKFYTNNIGIISIYIEAKRRIRKIEKYLEEIKKGSLEKKNNNSKKKLTENSKKKEDKNIYEKNIIKFSYDNVDYIKKNHFELNKNKIEINNIENIKRKKKLKNKLYLCNSLKMKNFLNKEKEKKIFTKNKWKKVKKNNNFKYSFLNEIYFRNNYKYLVRIKPHKYTPFNRKLLEVKYKIISNRLFNGIKKSFIISFFNNKKKLYKRSYYKNCSDYKKFILPFQNKKYYYNLLGIGKNDFFKKFKNISKFIDKPSYENVYELEKKNNSNNFNFVNETTKNNYNFCNSGIDKNCPYNVTKNNVKHNTGNNHNNTNVKNITIHEDNSFNIEENNNNNEKSFINKENDNYTTIDKGMNNKYSNSNNSTREDTDINLFYKLNNKLNVENNVEKERTKYIKNKIKNDKINNCNLNYKQNKERENNCIGYNIFVDHDAKIISNSLNKISYNLNNSNLLDESEVYKKFYDNSLRKKNIIISHNSINAFEAKNDLKLENNNNCKRNNIYRKYESMPNNNLLNSCKKNIFISSNNKDLIINSINCEESTDLFKFYNKNKKEKEKIGSLKLPELDFQLINKTNKCKNDKIERKECYFNNCENVYDGNENKCKNIYELDSSYNKIINTPFNNKEVFCQDNKKEIQMNSFKYEEQIEEKGNEDKCKKKNLSMKSSIEKIEQKKNNSKSYMKKTISEGNINECKEIYEEKYEKNKEGILYDGNNDKNRIYDQIFINNSNKNFTLNKLVNNINDKATQKGSEDNFLLNNNDFNIENVNLIKSIEQENKLNNKDNDIYDLNKIQNKNNFDSSFLRTNFTDFNENIYFPSTQVNDKYEEAIFRNIGPFEKDTKGNIAKKEISDSYKNESHDMRKSKEKVLQDNERIFYNINSSLLNTENNRLESSETINFNDCKINFNKLNFLNFIKNENYNCCFDINTSDNIINNTNTNMCNIFKDKDKNNLFIKKNDKLKKKDFACSELNSSINSLNEKNENYLKSLKNKRYNLKKLKSDENENENENENINIRLFNFCNTYCDKENSKLNERESIKKIFNCNDKYYEQNHIYDDENIQQSYKDNLSYISRKNFNDDYYSSEDFLQSFEHLDEMNTSIENNTFKKLSDSIINIGKLDKIIEKLRKMKIHIMDNNNYIQCIYCGKYLFKLENYSGEDFLSLSKNLNMRKENFLCTICKYKIKILNKYKDNITLKNGNIKKKNSKEQTNDGNMKMHNNTKDKIKYFENNFDLDNFNCFSINLRSRNKLQCDYIQNIMFNKNMHNNKKEFNFFQYNDSSYKDNSCNDLGYISDYDTEEKKFLFSNQNSFENKKLKSFGNCSTSPSLINFGEKYSTSNYIPNKGIIFNNEVTFNNVENKEKSDIINYHYPYNVKNFVFNNKSCDYYNKKWDYLNLENEINFKNKSYSSENFTFNNKSKYNFKKMSKNFSLNVNLLNKKKAKNDLLKYNDNDHIYYNSNYMNCTNNSDYNYEKNSNRNDSDECYKNLSKTYGTNIGVMNTKYPNNNTLEGEIEKNKIKESDQISITHKTKFENKQDKEFEKDEKIIIKKKELDNEIEDKKKIELEKEKEMIYEVMRKENEKRLNINNNLFKQYCSNFDYFKDKECNNDYEKKENPYAFIQNDFINFENKEESNLNIKNNFLKKLLSRNNSNSKEFNNFLYKKKNSFYDSFLMNKGINISENSIDTNNCFNNAYLNNLFISQREKDSLYY
ncbi:conserved Plasmodium protein, unknown function [Plasmodium relictum]|uniref:Uncharacterized protein n=1 Tax=Plasmodium relictum TaxID=85471 RepID=A0A1J1H9A2_PLARL|nr:conserved Plasmodium protein, unknown function [Plasmodium relictum]CRH01499.1 conserved Plasmodium protein, unknown function [Plasmodium relictum]